MGISLERVRISPYFCGGSSKNFKNLVGKLFVICDFVLWLLENVITISSKVPPLKSCQIRNPIELDFQKMQKGKHEQLVFLRNQQISGKKSDFSKALKSALFLQIYQFFEKFSFEFLLFVSLNYFCYCFSVVKSNSHYPSAISVL